MNDNTKTFLLKGIPESVWREFKIKLLQGGMNTYNECLLKLINSYTSGKISV